MSATVFTIGHYNDAGTLDRKFYLPFAKLDATAAPGVTDDDSAGFVAGSIWADTTNDAVYLCTDNATGAATWVAAGGSGGSGTVTSVDLSVVGAAFITISGNPVTTSGTLTQTWTGTTGDILYASGADTWSLLAAGTDGYVLTLASGVPTWAAATGTVSSVDATVTGAAFITVSGNPITSTGTIDFAWTGTTGDILYASGTNTWSLLGVGTDGYVLTLASGVPTWAAASAGTVTSVGITDPAAGITSSGGPITTSGNITLALANDLAALEALSGTDNIYYRSGADTWTSVTIGTGLSFSGGTLSATGSGTVTSVNLTAPAAGITVSGGPVTTSGSITLALADDLAALEALSGTDNIYYRSGANTWTSVTIGTGLSFSSGTLSATSGSGTVTDVSCADGSITVATGTTTPVLSLAQSRLGIQGGVTNIGFTYSASAGAGTVTLTDANGATPSASTPVSITFQDGDGSVTTVTQTSTLSETLVATTTLGTSGANLRVWVVIFNDAGTLRIGFKNCRDSTQVYPISESVASDSVALSSGGGSAGVFYTGTAVTGKYFRVLGYFYIGSLTPGTWVAASEVVLYTPGTHLPGDTVQIRKNQTGSTSNGTTTIPFDNTIPQNTEGTEFLTQAITPTSAANMLEVEAKAHFSSGTAAIWIIMALFRDSTADAYATTTKFLLTATEMDQFPISFTQASATTSSTTFKVRAGPHSAATCYFNSVGGSALFNGTINSYLTVREIMA